MVRSSADFSPIKSQKLMILFMKSDLSSIPIVVKDWPSDRTSENPSKA